MHNLFLFALGVLIAKGGKLYERKHLMGVPQRREKTCFSAFLKPATG